jgi:hypothetical protein
VASRGASPLTHDAPRPRTGLNPELRIQRALGNQAVGRLLQAPPNPGAPAGGSERTGAGLTGQGLPFASPPGAPLSPAWESLSRSAVSHTISQAGSDARIHTDAAAGHGASALGALAVTIGRHVYFGRNQYDPHTARGAHVLRHELAHVSQAVHDFRFDSARGLEVAPPDHPAELDAARVAHLGGSPSQRIHRPMAFRVVQNTPVARQTALQILGNPAAAPPTPGMTLQEFKDYTVAQADWFVEPSLTAGGARDALWQLLLIAEEGPHILAGVGDIHVADLRAVTAADWTPLRAYCRGTHASQPTIRIFPPLPPLADRIALGRTLISMEAIIPAARLETTVSQTQLVSVQTRGLLPVLTQYWTDFQPFLEQTFTPAPGAAGPEFARVLTFLNSLGAPGLVPLAPLRGPTPDERWVRNLHRFQLPMLLRLVVNLSDTSGARRLVLVLHTGHDAPAAFVQSAALLADLVLTSPNNLVLMVEGATSLAAVTARIPAITSTWGQLVAGVRRISQLLIAGHGSAQTVEMAGTAVPESLVAGTPNTQALLDALLTHMDPASARILYLGCLVGATNVPAGTPAAGIPAALAAQCPRHRRRPPRRPSAGGAGLGNARRRNLGDGPRGQSGHQCRQLCLRPQCLWHRRQLRSERA